MKGPAAGLSQQAGEAEGSPTVETHGRVGAALTTPGRVGTVRRSGSGKQGQKVYARNQRLTSRKSSTGSNLTDAGRAAVHAAQVGGDSDAGFLMPARRSRRSLRRRRGDAAGVELGADLADRVTVNVGSDPSPPCPGQARGPLLAAGRGGVPVVVGEAGRAGHMAKGHSGTAAASRQGRSRR
jgi:hypothetical protein